MIKTIAISDIDASNRLRPLDPAHVAFIAASIEERGLITPISLRKTEGGYRLVAGAHRLAAMIELGFSELAFGQHFIVSEADDLGAAIDEIDENLARHELNALDRALFLARRRAIYEEKHRTDKKGGDRKSHKFKEEINSSSCGIDFSPRFTLEVAERVGLSEDTISRALKIASSLDPQAIAALRGTRLEYNQKELLALCALRADEQYGVAQKIAAAEIKTVAQGRVALGLDEEPAREDLQTRLWSQLLRCWDQASTQTRAAFLKEIKAEIIRPTKKA